MYFVEDTCIRLVETCAWLYIIYMDVESERQAGIQKNKEEKETRHLV